MIEIKVIVALVCREFDFEKVGFDGITQEEVYDVTPRFFIFISFRSD